MVFTFPYFHQNSSSNVHYFLHLLILLFSLLLCSSCKEEITIITAKDNLSNPNLHPKVVSTYPPNGGVGPFNIRNSYNQYSLPHFIITFNKLMNVNTVNNSSVKISGFESGTTISAYSRAYSSFSNLLYFQVTDSQRYYKSYRAEKTYTITIDTTVKDINGNHLTSPYQFSFTPHPTFDILGIEPGSTQHEVVTAQPIEIYFNSAVNSSILDYIQILPTLSYYPEFSTDSLFVMLIPSEGLSPNQTYTITIFAGAHDSYHSVMAKNYSSSFHTIEFKFTASSPNNNNNNLSTTNTIYFFFTSTVLPSSIASSIISTPPINGSFSVYDKTIYYYINSPLIEDSAYTIKILPTLKSVSGEPLDTTITINFRTTPFQIYSYSPSYREQNVSRFRGIQITCNTNIDTSTVRSAFSMSPTTPGIFQLSNNSNTFYYQPNNPLLADSTYTVSISTQLKSAHGKPLKYSSSFNFKTGH